MEEAERAQYAEEIKKCIEFVEGVLDAVENALEAVADALVAVAEAVASAVEYVAGEIVEIIRSCSREAAMRRPEKCIGRPRQPIRKRLRIFRCRSIC